MNCLYVNWMQVAILPVFGSLLAATDIFGIHYETQ